MVFDVFFQKVDVSVGFLGGREIWRVVDEVFDEVFGLGGFLSTVAELLRLEILDDHVKSVDFLAHVQFEFVDGLLETLNVEECSVLITTHLDIILSNHCLHF